MSGTATTDRRGYVTHYQATSGISKVYAMGMYSGLVDQNLQLDIEVNDTLTFTGVADWSTKEFYYFKGA